MTDSQRWLASVFLTGMVGVSTANAEDRAIIIGISTYRQSYMKPLHGAADAECMRRLIVSYFGFADAQVECLVSGSGQNEPTLARISEAMSRAVKESRPGDRVFFYYAGHGTQVVDEPNGDEVDYDGCDEALCPADYDRNNADTAIRDDRIGAWLAELAGRHVTLFFDCCHSATLSRNLNGRMIKDAGMGPEGVITRFESPQAACAPRPPAANRQNERVQRRRMRFSRAGDATSFVCFSACEDSQRAVEIPVAIGATVAMRGAFTWHFIQELTRSDADRAQSNCENLMQFTRTTLAARALSAQKPQLRVGGDARPTAAFLGGAKRPFGIATQAGSVGEIIAINHGAVNGVQIGDRFAVAAGAGNQAASLEVVHVEEFSAQCRFVAGANLNRGQMVTRDLRYIVDPIMGVRLRTDVAATRAEIAVKKALDAERKAGRMTLRGKAESFQVEVRLGGDKKAYDASVHGLLGDVRWKGSATDAQALSRAVIQRLRMEHDLRWLSRLAAAPGCGADARIEDTSGRTTFVIRKQANETDVIQLSVTPTRGCYVTLIAVDALGEIDVLYPNAEAARRDGFIAANESAVVVKRGSNVFEQLRPQLPAGPALFRAITTDKPLGLYVHADGEAGFARVKGKDLRFALEREAGVRQEVLPNQAGIRMAVDTRRIGIADLYVETVEAD